MPFRPILPLVAAALLIAACADARAQEPRRPNEAELIETFLRAAPQADARAPAAPARLTRWEKPVHVGLIASRIATTQADFIDEQVTRLARITGHEVSFVRSGKAEAAIVVSDDPFLDLDREDFRRMLGSLAPAALAAARASRGRMPCYTVLLHAQNRVASALAGIMTKLGDEMFRGCVVTVLAELMGLRNSAPGASWSVLRRTYEFRALPPDDAIMLRLLYDARLAPGMTADEIRAVAPPIVAELRGRR